MKPLEEFADIDFPDVKEYTQDSKDIKIGPQYFKVRLNEIPDVLPLVAFEFGGKQNLFLEGKFVFQADNREELLSYLES